jgi:calcineurin-like phosphoesterase family protein
VISFRLAGRKIFVFNNSWICLNTIPGKINIIRTTHDHTQPGKNESFESIKTFARFKNIQACVTLSEERFK